MQQKLFLGQKDVILEQQVPNLVNSRMHVADGKKAF